MNVEEYLGVMSVAGALPLAADDPDCTLDSILARAAASGPTMLRSTVDKVPRPTSLATSRRQPNRLGLAAAAALAVALIGGSIWWRSDGLTSDRLAAAHGDQQTVRLADNSVLHLNTDTSVTVRYGRTERVVDMERGQAFFVVTHDATRPFRVIVGQTDVVAVGTQFEVYRRTGSTLVTVLEGRVSVGTSGSTNRRILVREGEQLQLGDAPAPAAPTRVNVENQLAWLRRQIAFDHEPLATVTAEFNRYSAIPIEIESPSLKAFVVSGVFSVDDTDTFLAFLRSLRGVRVDSTAARIRVTGQPSLAPARPSAAH